MSIFTRTKKVIVACLSYRRQCAWLSYYNKMRRQTSANPSFYQGVDAERLLLISPHADDELLSSFSLIKRKKVDVYYCGLTGSTNSESNRETRKRELESFCSAMKIRLFHGDEHFTGLTEILSNHTYDAILLPSIVDWHHEHRLVNYRLLSTLTTHVLAPRILWYTISVPMYGREKDLCYSLLSREEQGEKVQLFEKCYPSQTGININRFSIRERINALPIGGYAAEVFSSLSFEEWTRVVKKVRDAETERENELLSNLQALKHLTNDLAKISNLSIKIHKSLGLL